MNPDIKEDLFENNLITNFDQTIELIRQIEGEAWFNGYLKDVKDIISKLKESQTVPDPEEVFDSFNGDGGITRWMVMGNGEVRFSSFHDTGDPFLSKTKKAQELGFKLF
jgi:hypothetical protein